MVTGAAGLLGLLLLWQAAAMILNDQVALPSVVQTGQQFLRYLDRPYPAQGRPLWFDLYISLRRILIGFAAGSATAAGAPEVIEVPVAAVMPVVPLAALRLVITALTSRVPPFRSAAAAA